jgi:RNA polymerase-binding transcription factor DksA
MADELKVRYSDVDLEEFRVLIEKKISKAEEELTFNRQQIDELNEGGFNQQGGDLYEDTSLHSTLDMLNRMVMRDVQLIQNLNHALLRIRNKAYGICIVTGNLIDKKRLLAVPHATKSVEGKNLDNESKEIENQLMAAQQASGYNAIEEEAKIRMSDKKPTKKKVVDYDDDGAPTDDTRNSRSSDNDD